MSESKTKDSYPLTNVRKLLLFRTVRQLIAYEQGTRHARLTLISHYGEELRMNYHQEAGSPLTQKSTKDSL